MIEIIPSLPALTYQELTTKLAMVKGLVNTFQIDVCDGLFVPSRSWPMNPGDDAQFERIVQGKEKFPYADEFEFEVHFMSQSPEKLLESWGRVGITRALFHVEARHDFSTLRAVSERFSIELGIALKIGTPLSRIESYLPHIAMIQLMGIDPIGVQGQPFDRRVLPMLREAKALYPDVILQVDGAVNADTAPLLVDAGVTRLAPGSYIFKDGDPRQEIELLTSYERNSH